MADMTNETFRVALMASEDVQSLLVTVKYQTGSGDTAEFAPVHDGALVVLGNLAKNDPYNYGITATDKTSYDDNTYLATAPAATTDKVVIVDLSTVSNGEIMGNNYRIGIRQYGLVMEAGMPARARRLMPGDKFWLSNDCIKLGEDDDEPAIGNFITATAGDTHHSLATTAPTSGYYAKIEDYRDFVVGNKVIGKLYLCCVQ